MMISTISRILLASIFSLLAIYTDEALAAFSLVMSAENYAIPKIAGCFLAVFGAPDIARVLRYSLDSLASACAQKKPSDRAVLEGVPVDEILDHLFTVGTFRREDMESRFAMSRSTYERLAARLDKVGVLVRGKNNARVLSPDFAR